MTGLDFSSLPSVPGLDLKQFAGMGSGGSDKLAVGSLAKAGIEIQGPEEGGRKRRLVDGVASPFEGVLADSIAKVQNLQDDVRAKVRGMALGENVELHDVLIATNKSEVAFNLLLEVRNKLVEAWDKLSRSSV